MVGPPGRAGGAEIPKEPEKGLDIRHTMPYDLPMTNHATKHLCDAGNCDQNGAVDLRAERKVVGLAGVVRYLCADHAARYTPKALARTQAGVE